MNIKQWIESKQSSLKEQGFLKDEMENKTAGVSRADVAVARALGISVRQLQRRLGREAANRVSFVKPEPHFRAALVARQSKARP